MKRFSITDLLQSEKYFGALCAALQKPFSAASALAMGCVVALKEVPTLPVDRAAGVGKAAVRGMAVAEIYFCDWASRRSSSRVKLALSGSVVEPKLSTSWPSRAIMYLWKFHFGA